MIESVTPWKLTPQEEAEVLERYDQSTPEIRRGITLEFARRAIEASVMLRRLQAVVDAERAKAAVLLTACKTALPWVAVATASDGVFGNPPHPKRTENHARDLALLQDAIRSYDSSARPDVTPRKDG